MNKELRILIFGPSGAGATTLGYELSKKLTLNLIDSDDLFWLPTSSPYSLKRSPKEIRDLYSKLTNTKSFIVTGDLLSLNVHWKELHHDFSHLIYLYAPWKIRKERLIKREFLRFGERIKDGGDMYHTHLRFLKWASRYDECSQVSRNKLKHHIFYNEFESKDTKRLKLITDSSVDRLLQKSLCFIQEND